MTGRIALVIKVAAILRDLCLLGAGLLVARSTPPSLEAYAGGRGWAAVWAAMLFLGALGSLYGVVRARPSAETVGCFTVGGGFLIWGIAALAQDDPTQVSVAIGLVFLAGCVGQVLRGAYAAARLTPTQSTAPPESPPSGRR